MRGMSDECRDGMKAAGVTSAATLVQKTDILDSLAVRSTPPPAIFKSTSVCWPCVFIHCCEVYQITRDIARADLEIVLSAPQAAIASAIEAQVTLLQKEERLSRGCHAVLVTRAAIEACEQLAATRRHTAAIEALDQRAATMRRGQASSQGSLTIRGHETTMKRPASESNRARSTMLKKPAYLKACPICGAEVRNDVISRHMKTPKCMGAAIRASISSEAGPPA